MKTFQSVTWNADAARAERARFRELLATHDILAESQHVLPLLRESPQLALCLGNLYALGAECDRIALEYNLFGDFACDLAVGTPGQKAFVFVEFEAAEPESIIRRQGRKATREWASSFARGFCQIVDWFTKLADLEKTDDFENRFGARSIDYAGVLVIGRDHDLEPSERRRFEWWRSHLLVDSRPVVCVTYDELLSRLDAMLARYERALPRRRGKS